MWAVGHRGNNTFLSLCLLFVIFYRLSPEFHEQVQRFINNISHSDVKIRRRFMSMAAVAVLLVILHLVDGQLGSLWDLDWEGGIGTTFSGYLLAVASLLCYFCWRQSEKGKDRIAWTLFGILLMTMTVDELSEFHHGLARLLWHSTTGQDQTVLIKGLEFWILVLSPFILSIIGGLIWFVRHVLHKASRTTAAVALIAWVTSQALEATIASKILPHSVEVATEEFLEMFGTILLIVTFHREYGLRTSEKKDSIPESLQT